MKENRGLEFLDYLFLLVKWKKSLLILFLSTLIIAYLAIFFFIKPEYEGTATIIPVEESTLSGFAGLMKGLSSLPFNIGGLTKTTEMDMYNTIVYSRSNIDSVIDKFGLMKVYEYKNREVAVKAVRKLIRTDVTLDNAYIISARALTPQSAADMTNYIVKLLNRRIIELNISKSKDNRLFLERRYNEIKDSLRVAEVLLRNYQQQSGVFEAEEQIKATIEAYANLDAELAKKEVELTVLGKIFGNSSPQFKNAQISESAFKNMIQNMKEKGNINSLILPINSLPTKALDYFRLYRNVKIYNTMLEFIIPMYEQAKFEEQKDTPVLQVVDYAIPPIKRAYPPRVLMSLIITIIVMLIVFLILAFREILENSSNPKVIILRKEIFNFRSNK